MILFSLSKQRILPGFGISLGSTLLFLSLILFLPLSALIMQICQMSLSQFWFTITSPELLFAYKITLLSAGLAALFNAFFGMLISWILTQYRFPGRILLDGLIDLPFALPTAVAGLTLAELFSNVGWYGGFLVNFNIKISYTWLGITIAMIFTSIPFVVRTVQPILEVFSVECREAAKILGAKNWYIFINVLFPELFPSLLIGTLLSFVRSLGEFGAVIFIAGNIACKTEVVSLIIFTRLQEYNYSAASAVGFVVLFVSLVLFFIVNILQFRFINKIKVR